MKLLKALALLVVIAAAAYGQAPGTMQYQGRLLDSVGDAVTTQVTVDFVIYDSTIGGTPLWSESVTFTPDGEGVFTVLLGGSQPVARHALARPLPVLRVRRRRTSQELEHSCPV